MGGASKEVEVILAAQKGTVETTGKAAKPAKKEPTKVPSEQIKTPASPSSTTLPAPGLRPVDLETAPGPSPAQGAVPSAPIVPKAPEAGDDALAETTRKGATGSRLAFFLGGLAIGAILCTTLYQLGVL